MLLLCLASRWVQTWPHKSTFAIAAVELEQGLGHVNVSLEVLDVVQDTQQDLLLGVLLVSGLHGHRDQQSQLSKLVRVVFLILPVSRTWRSSSVLIRET